METATENITMAKYPAYKNSGVEWLREIPEHWNIEKGKWLFEKQERPISPGDEIITCFRDGEVTLRKNRKTDGFTNALKEHGYQGIKKGDLVIHNMDAFAGAIGVSDSDGKSTPVYSVCTARIENIVNPYYYAYFLRDLAKLGYIESLAKGIRERSSDFRFNDFGILLLPLPPLEEQTAIANFLDVKTTQIDKAIAQKEKQIELLKERRQILIHQAVTRGLNPDVPLKDSGIDWGQIPEHWEVKRLSSIGHFQKGGGISKDKITVEGLPAVLYGDIYTKYDVAIRNVINKIDIETAKKAISISSNTILFTGSGETIEDIGKCVAYIGDELCYVGGDVIIFIQKSELSLFLSYVLDSHKVKGEKAKDAKGEIIVHTYSSKLKNIKIPLPPLTEQQEIVDFLENLTDQTKNAISSKLQEIEKLKEYKAVLINAAVTGKIKVG